MKMFSLLLLLLLAATGAHAQILRFGVKGGVTFGYYSFPQQYFDDATVTRSRSNSQGFQTGIVLRLQVPKFINIQPELLYSQRKYHYLVTSGSTTNRVDEIARRLELPVTFGFNIYALRFFGGPVFRISSGHTIANRVHNFKVAYNDSDIALTFGIGLEIGHFFLDSRYTFYPGTSYNKMTVGHQTRRIKVSGDETWQINAGFFF